MATPNINDSTKNITGKTAGTALTTTNATAVLTNSSTSNALYRVTSLYAANIDGANNCDITLKWFGAATGGTGFALASTVNVPADGTLVLISKDAPVYLVENSRLEATAAAANVVDIVVSYEEIV